jgi:putative Mg2+ transporter-C (MgtC) family protein
MAIELMAAGINMGVALTCGAVIGSERQVRQRLAGLRTNALVALAAAGFVVFSQLVPNEVSPTRVAAQVVSGIGFLGAGIIFRDGFNIHGLNTAATLWCAASVGLIAGIGEWEFALLMTALVVFVNLGLRPLVKFLKRHTMAGADLTRHYRIKVTPRPGGEEPARARLLTAIGAHGLRLSEMEATAVGLVATVAIDERVAGQTLEKAMMELATSSDFAHTSWEMVEEG